MKITPCFLTLGLLTAIGCGSYPATTNSSPKGTPEEGDSVTAALRTKFAAATPITRDEQLAPFIGEYLSCISHDARSYAEPSAGAHNKRYTNTLLSAGSGFYYWYDAENDLLTLDSRIGLNVTSQVRSTCGSGTASTVYRLTQDDAIIAETSETSWFNTCGGSRLPETASVSYPAPSRVYYYAICSRSNFPQ